MQVKLLLFTFYLNGGRPGAPWFYI